VSEFIDVQVNAGCHVTDPIVYVDDADWYSRFKMNHESACAPLLFGRSVWSYRSHRRIASDTSTAINDHGLADGETALRRAFANDGGA
jgi:hypothetical protein